MNFLKCLIQRPLYINKITKDIKSKVMHSKRERRTLDIRSTFIRDPTEFLKRNYRNLIFTDDHHDYEAIINYNILVLVK